MTRIRLAGKAVLITGTSSGIGRAIGEHLAGAGMQVLACARKQADIDALNAIPNIIGLCMDVTRLAQIEAVADRLAERGPRLYAIVNNAGIAVGGPMLSLPESELVECLQVNTVGPVNVVRVLYPYMEQGGCIVNVSSMGGQYVTPWMAPYHMSKFALEAYSESLRMELAPFGTRVAIVEPGAVKTQAFYKWERFVDQMRDTVYERAFSRYWGLITAQHRRALDPLKIAEVVKGILQDPTPKKRYLVPHRFAVRAVILLAKLGLSDWVYRRFLADVEPVPPSYFRAHK